MYRTRLFSVLLVTLFTSYVSAQQTSGDQEDLDALAAENLVRELRSIERPPPEPVSDATIEEWLAGGSLMLDRMLEQGCVLDTPLSLRIRAMELQLGSVSSEESEIARELKLEMVELKQQARRNCCEQESVMCFQ